MIVEIKYVFDNEQNLIRLRNKITSTKTLIKNILIIINLKTHST